MRWFDKQSLPAADIYEQLQQREALGDDSDLLAHLRERYGEHEAEGLRAGLQEDLERAWDEQLGPLGRQVSSATSAPARERIWQNERPRLILMHLPDGLFASAIEAACERLPYNFDLYHDAPAPPPQPYVNGVFAQHGVPYRLTDDGVMDWVGDVVPYELAIAPSLGALADERFAVAAEDFEHALVNVRRGSAKSRKDAVNDATKALEGAMVAVLESHQVPVPDRRQVNVLWLALRDCGLVPQELMEVLTAGSKVSNARGRHTNPEPVTQAEAEASVAVVATAITYLASRLG